MRRDRQWKDFLPKSQFRYKKLSEIFLQLHISEKTGRGVPIVTQRYGRNAYEFRENSIVVTIPFNWMNVMGDKAGNKEVIKTTSTA